jgi:hypothetical protein
MLCFSHPLIASLLSPSWFKGSVNAGSLLPLSSRLLNLDCCLDTFLLQLSQPLLKLECIQPSGVLYIDVYCPVNDRSEPVSCLAISCRRLRNGHLKMRYLIKWHDGCWGLEGIAVDSSQSQACSRSYGKRTMSQGHGILRHILHVVHDWASRHPTWNMRFGASNWRWTDS